MSDEQAIRQVLDDIAARHAQGDATGVIASYSPNAVVYDLAPPMQVDHTAEGLKTWMGKFDAPPSLSYQDVTIHVAGDFAAAWGFMLTRTRLDSQPDDFWRRMTWVLRREGEAWTIIHAHGSVPFYMDGSLKAALDLEPVKGPPETGA